MPTAFFPQVSKAVASFFGFAAVGALAESTHPAPPDVQAWTESSITWQSLSLPQAAACFAQLLSTHLPQSVLSNDGVGGGDDAAGSGVLAGAGVSAADDADADAAEAAESEAAGSVELPVEAVSLAGLSAGLDPPPQASQASGTETRRTRVVRGSNLARIMVPHA